MTAPVVEGDGVSHFVPERLQQLPVEAVPAREGLPVGEDEADRVVPGEADVAVRPVGHVLHQPLHTHQGRAVDVQRSTWPRHAQYNETTQLPGLPSGKQFVSFFVVFSSQFVSLFGPFVL